MSPACAASALLLPLIPKPSSAAAFCAFSAEREPMITVRPALASRRAIAAPSLPVPPTTAITASFVITSSSFGGGHQRRGRLVNCRALPRTAPCRPGHRRHAVRVPALAVAPARGARDRFVHQHAAKVVRARLPRGDHALLAQLHTTRLQEIERTSCR